MKSTETTTTTARRNELCVNGTSIHRFTFVADAMVKIVAARDIGLKHAIEVADECFDALCARFQDDSETVEDVEVCLRRKY